MITRPTVLILGAAASMPYGFPSGPDLKKLVFRALSEWHNTRRLPALLQHNGHTVEKIKKFQFDLGRSPDYSIDAFLEHHEDYIVIGKEAIAGVLLPNEKDSYLFENWLSRDAEKLEGSWYQHLFNELVVDTNINRFEKNQLSVVTFNYDRSLEHFLFESLKSKFQGLQDCQCTAILSNIPIIHVYGSLGRLSWQKSDSDSEIPYNTRAISSQPEEMAERIRNAGESIKILHEYKRPTIELNKAHELLREAERIYFLGYGYNPVNTKRLLPGLLIKKENMWGTAYKISPHLKRKLAQMGMRNWIESRIRPLPHYFNQTIMDFLVNNPDSSLS